MTSIITHMDTLSLYKKLYRPRAIESRMLIALRQGRISKWFSSWGQEAVAVGTSLAMQQDEWICTMHRNLGVFTSRDVDLVQLFAQFQGSTEGFTKGRDRSFHFGSKAHKIFGMISHLGAQLGIADGLALADKINGEGKCTLVFSGDGGASEGDFHESLNVAAVWGLPVLVVIENNQWGLSTPSSEQYAHGSFVVKGEAYGIEAHSVDGNNLEEVYRVTSELAASIRENPRPILLECRTFRMRGHEEASGTKYYPEGLIESWEDKDPVAQMRQAVLDQKLIGDNALSEWESSVDKEVLQALNQALTCDRPVYDAEAELNDVFADEPLPSGDAPSREGDRSMRMIDAIHEALGDAMDTHSNLVFMGQDIADYGGVFKATDGMVERFGKDRVRNTPICESAIVGAGVGLSAQGMKAMVEMQFSDFVTEAMTQICNQAAKLHYRWGQNVDMVIRMPTGAGVNAGPFHSQSTEAWFTRVPGLKVVYPSNAYDAKGLMLAAFNSPNPVMVFEHKALYRSEQSHVPKVSYELPLDQARCVQSGDDVSIITYGMGVHWAMQWQKENPSVSVELIDLISLAPLDFETCIESARKTGKCVVLTEDTARGSVAHDVSQAIHNEAFESLDAPVEVVSSEEIPIPFAAELEAGFLAHSKLDFAMNKVLNY